MSFITKKDTQPSVKQILLSYGLPVYIIISVLFIISVLWSYVMGVIYNSWVVAWQQQALEVWQQQWYTKAVQQMTDEATKDTCEVVTLTLGEKQVNVINIDCLDVNTSEQASEQVENIE